MTFDLRMNSPRSSDKKQHIFKKNNKKIKKHHWFLGTAVVLIGSWITHSTTANITKKASLEKQSAALVTLNQPSLAPIVDLQELAVLSPLPEITIPTVADAEPTEKFNTLTHTIKKGESLGIIFRKLGLDLSLPYKISKHPDAKQLVSLSVGKQLVFKTDSDNALRSIAYPKNALQEFVVNFNNNDIIDAQTLDLPFQTHQQIVSGEISSSLYEAALEVGMSNRIVMEMVRIFGWDVDFVLDIRAGDHFHVIYETHTRNEKRLLDGDILAAEFTTQGQTYRAIRFKDKNDNISYYTPEGESMLGTFLRSPVEFSRISSRFGKRKHPILKTWRAHNGVDYAARTGTPIRSTADGKVVSVGTKGGYGRTVVINHAGRFSTLYAHMNGYAKGIKKGSRVKQGQTIGYVGSSGLATGPHLHYEFRVDGVHRNSLTYKTPKASSISEQDKPAFTKITNAMVAELDAIDQNYQLTKAATKPASTSL